jgi:hypothetical protein
MAMAELREVEEELMKAIRAIHERLQDVERLAHRHT